MEKKEALKIIRMIAQGEDPYKDEARAKYLPEHNPDTLKALCTAIASLFPIDDQENEISSGQPLILDNFLKGFAEKFMKKLGKDAIVEALIKADYKEDETAEILGISYTELLNKIKKYDINQEIELRVLLRPVETDYRYILNRISLDEYLEKIEKNAILKALEKTPLKQDAADLLGISFRILRYRIEKLKIGLKNIESSSSVTVTSDYFKHSLKGMPLNEFLNTIEKKIIELAIKETDLKQDAAEKLGISFRTLRYRIEKLGIE